MEIENVNIPVILDKPTVRTGRTYSIYLSNKEIDQLRDFATQNKTSVGAVIRALWRGFYAQNEEKQIAQRN